MPTYGKQTSAGGGGSGLTPIANNTMLGNVSGSAATPAALTSAQILTLLGITPYSSSAIAALIDAQALCGATLTAISGSEFGELNVDTTSTISGGTVTLSTTAKGGVIQAASNGTAGGAARFRMLGDGALTDNSKTSKWYFTTRFQFPTGMDTATDAKIRIAASNGGNTTYEFGQRGVTQTANFNLFLKDSANATIFDGSSGVAVDTAWHTLKIYNEGTNLVFVVDGVTVKTQVLSALAGGDPVYMEVFARNSTTAANRQINLDYWWFVSTTN